MSISRAVRVLCDECDKWIEVGQNMSDERARKAARGLTPLKHPTKDDGFLYVEAGNLDFCSFKCGEEYMAKYKAQQ